MGKMRFYKLSLLFALFGTSAAFGDPVLAESPQASQSEAEAYTAPVRGENSISSLEKVSIGGTEQWITIRGGDRSNPVLLYLHGGPGHAEMGSNSRFSQLEKRYVVVNWDQRGAGKSFSKDLPKESLQIEQFLTDTHDMVEMLKQRFGRDKIYLVGHSWGSLLGMIEVSRHPESFYAYVGVGQLVDVTRGDRIGYEFTLNKAKELGNQDAVKELEEVGPPPYASFADFLKYRKWIVLMGGVFYSPTYIQDVMIPDIRNATEYTPEEKQNYELGEELSLTTIVPELSQYKLLNLIHEVKVPVYFVAGKHDYNTPIELVRELNDQISAPHKELILFEKSGHAPNYEEEQHFAQIMNQYVFNQTYYMSAAGEQVRVLFDGKEAPDGPVVLKGQLAVPLRSALEAFGASVQWEASTRSILISRGEMQAVLKLGSAAVSVGNREVQLATPIALVDGAAYASVEALEILGLQTAWNEKANELSVRSK